MRDAYQDQLDELAVSLANMCEEVAEALAKATRALLESDLHLAEEVITEDVRIDELRDRAEEQGQVGELARQRVGSHTVSGPGIRPVTT